MTLRHLRIFATVATCGTMRAAAEELFISQPAVSQAVRELEKYYDVRLFERLSQRLYLTDEGKMLLPRARHLLDAFDAAEQELRAHGTAPCLRLGASVTCGTWLMPRLAQRLETRVAGLDLRVTVNNTSKIEQQLTASALDAAVVEGEVGDTDLIQKPLCADELVLVVGRGHPFFLRGEVTLDDLAGCALIDRESGSAERNQYKQYLTAHGVSMTPKWSSSNTETIKRVVGEGRGAAIFSARMVAEECAAGKLRTLALRGAAGESVRIWREMRLIYHKDKYISPALQAFFDVCAEENGKDYRKANK